MNKGWRVPPECCVIIEMEQGASLGAIERQPYWMKLWGLGPLEKAAKASRLDAGHAREIISEMNQDFSQPLIVFHGNPCDCDVVQLTTRGEEVARLYWRQFEPVWLSIIDERSRHYWSTGKATMAWKKNRVGTACSTLVLSRYRRQGSELKSR